MAVIAVIIGVALVASVLADLVNTLVATNTSTGRWWLTRILYTNAWRFVRRVTGLMPNERSRETLIATFAPISVLLLLVVWVTQQIVGFGLIWWGLGGLNDAGSLFDSIYYSGVVYFTLGFGELVPVQTVPRIGALVEAMSGVLTTALVMGYLPSLYSAYSDRERKLMTLDDASEGRITPTNLILNRSPNDATYAEADAAFDDPDGLFQSMYGQLQQHGFELIPIDDAREETLRLRRLFDAQMEYLIDLLLAPRGFWGHRIGHHYDIPAAVTPPP